MLLDNVHWKFKQREKKHLRMLDAQEISKPQRKSRKLPREMSKGFDSDEPWQSRLVEREVTSGSQMPQLPRPLIGQQLT